MKQFICGDCGTVFDGTNATCPKCGCPKSECQEYESSVVHPIIERQINPIPPTPKKDRAHYVYECAALFWNTVTQRYADFSGRASRREFWSFILIPCTFPFLLLALYPLTGLIFLLCIIPYIGVWVRRMHDINKSGWWCLCPIACFFLALKRSDEGENDYGEPMDYSEILS